MASVLVQSSSLHSHTPGSSMQLKWILTHSSHHSLFSLSPGSLPRLLPLSGTLLSESPFILPPPPASRHLSALLLSARASPPPGSPPLCTSDSGDGSPRSQFPRCLGCLPHCPELTGSSLLDSASSRGLFETRDVWFMSEASASPKGGFCRGRGTGSIINNNNSSYLLSM